MRLCLIEWIDSTVSCFDWTTKDDFSQAHVGECWTVGFISKETEVAITIGTSRGKTSKILETTIPRGCIKRIRYLKVAP